MKGLRYLIAGDALFMRIMIKKILTRPDMRSLVKLITALSLCKRLSGKLMGLRGYVRCSRPADLGKQGGVGRKPKSSL
jgi:hypothetical protein